MTDVERSILMGMIVGDGCLTSSKRSLKIYHSTKQREYLEYKKKLVEQILSKKINTCNSSNLHYSGNTYHTCGFTVSHPFFKSIYDSIYIDGKKTLTMDYLKQLTKEAIAIWIMDDGSTGCRIHKERAKTEPSSIYIDLSTYCSHTQAELVVDYFKEVWDIYPKIRCTGKNKPDLVKWNINFNTKESKKLCSLIEAHIIPTMQYKLRYVLQHTKEN